MAVTNRMTNSMLVNNFTGRLNVNMNKLSNIQFQLATNKKFAHMSDDPIALIYSQEARYKLRVVSDYKLNVQAADKWMTQVESAVMELNEIIKSAYETCIDASTDVKSGYDRGNIAAYIAQLRDQSLQTLNMALGDRFVFGAFNTTGYTDTAATELTPPFYLKDVSANPGVDPPEMHLFFNNVDITLDDPQKAASFYRTDAGMIALREDVISLDLGIGISMNVTFNGMDIAAFTYRDGTTQNNIYQLLDEFYQALSDPTNTAVDINDFISPLQDAQNHLLSRVAEIGGKSRRLEVLSVRYDTDTLNYTEMLSNAEDADQAEVIMHYKMAEATYKAALSTGSYIIQNTLMDFLR